VEAGLTVSGDAMGMRFRARPILQGSQSNALGTADWIIAVSAFGL
jgi:hypothetical protein